MTAKATVAARLTALFGILRTLSCGGWVYITSSDDHSWHDIFMISYLVCGLLYMVGMVWTSRRSSLPFLVYWFVQHKIKRIPGAYSVYACFEWAVILFDVGFDHASAIDLKETCIELPLPSRAGAPKMPRSVDATAPAEVAAAPVSFSSISSHIVDTYMACLFWSMNTSLGLVIWYFPLWNMGISGFEAFLFVTLSPTFLAIRIFRRVVHRFSGVFHLLSLIGLLSYHFTDPTVRLVCVGVGVGLSTLSWASSFLDGDGLGSTVLNWNKCLPFLLGLLVSNVLKIYNYSLNPLWPTVRPEHGGLQLPAFALGIVACFQIMLRTHASEFKGETMSKADGEDAASSGTTSSPELKQPRKPKHWLAAATGLGSVLFLLHSMLSDSGIFCRWAVDGYPHPGPDPVYGGTTVLLAMGLGIALSKNQVLVTKTGWWALGTAGVFALYVAPKWSTAGRSLGFLGGLLFAVHTMSVAPALLQQMAFFPAGRTFFVGTFIYCLLQLAHVWVVAYAFVPGGIYLRERTEYVIGAAQLLLLAGVLSARHTLLAAQAREPIAIRDRSSKREYNRSLYTMAVIYVVLSAVVGSRLAARTEPKPFHPEERLMTSGIWTIHFGLDNEMFDSHQRMAAVIQELEMDVIGLLESDTYRIVFGNRDISQYLAETLGYYVDYGPSPTKHTWGCTMLSKFPIKRSTHLLLPSPVGELACAIHATLDVYGTEVDVSVSHNGQEEDKLDRELQTAALADIMNKSPNPFVFLGYVVTKPGLKNPLYRTLTEVGRVADVDPLDSSRWCQYIFFRGLHRVAYARISHGGITDTEIQAAKFVLQSPEDAKKELVAVGFPDEIPKSRQFPSTFYWPGTRGHRYHVFNRPKYWNIAS
ncbi:hypothetical protein BC832DRAFT_529869 [Gaertneriomyces semiglobifer]|nr:hypothetical protein BC832DRAFT_529869 [Gaertneriomyces semiglobifer]